ncbi:MAG: hypothetical protein ACREDR_29295 [Blastocatellia bacterium]
MRSLHCDPSPLSKDAGLETKTLKYTLSGQLSPAKPADFGLGFDALGAPRTFGGFTASSLKDEDDNNNDEAKHHDDAKYGGDH